MNALKSVLSELLNKTDMLVVILALAALVIILIFIITIVLFKKHSHKKNAELRELDYLTKIYNRYYYYKRCREFLTETESKYAMIAFDVDKFKLVNEYYGTEEADKLLIKIANKLISCFENGQITKFGRIESDKFSWIMPADKDKIKKVFGILDTIRLESKHVITFNMGVYFIETNKMDVEQAYARASIASKSIKGVFDKQIAYFDHNMIQKMEQEQFIVNKIDSAIANEDILVYFQPKYDLQLDQICGAEALVRWNDPERGMISPSDFVPALENNGLITKLDKFIWERTARYLSKWLNDGLNPAPVSINISKVDLLEVDLPDIIEGLVIKYNLPHNLFELEITESAYVDGQVDVTGIIKRFKNKGFTILMDDFGSGYSSLNTLRQFPIDILKIDLKFLAGFDRESTESVKGKTIIESIVSMAKNLNLSIVVEGTETIEQVEYIRSIGCEVAQGYYFSKPIPADEYIAMIKEGRKLVKNATFSSRLTEDTIWSKSIITEDFFNNTTCALGVFIYRRDRLEAIRLNEEYFNLIESNRKDFYTKSRNVLEDVYSLDLNKVMNAIEECISTKSTVEVIYRRVNVTGNLKWVRNKFTYVNNQDPSVSYFFASIDDITNEMKSKEMQDNIINALEYAFMKADADTNSIIFANEKLCNLMQISHDDLMNKYEDDFYKIFNPADTDTIAGGISNAQTLDSIRISSTLNTNNLPVTLVIKKVQEAEKLYIYFSIIKKRV